MLPRAASSKHAADEAALPDSVATRRPSSGKWKVHPPRAARPLLQRGPRCNNARTRRTASAGRPQCLTRGAPGPQVTIDAPLDIPPAEVIEGRVFLGDKTHATDLATLRRLGITRVLNVSRDSSSPWASAGMEYCHCYVADSVNADISRYFDEVPETCPLRFRRGFLVASMGA